MNVPSAPRRLADLEPAALRSGLAAWFGWLFDGLDMHLYTLVATPFVAQLIGVTNLHDPDVGYYSSWIQASFLLGWALGGGLFGRLGDLIGRSHALMLTILTYAIFTGLGYFAQAWWHLLIFRFLAALGIGGEWAVGATLLSETWPRAWRLWIAAWLQTAVNCGILLAMFAVLLMSFLPISSEGQYRSVFLVGILPALLVLWIRRAAVEPAEWRAAQHGQRPPGVAELFRGTTRRVTILTLLVCGLSLTAHWAFMFWCFQQLRALPEITDWSDAAKTRLASAAMAVLMVSSIAGNFFAAWLARKLGGYRRAITLIFLMYFVAMLGVYAWPLPWQAILALLPALGLTSGVFALFTMYLPPLFPVLLRTTGAGFCYNFGRVAAAVGTVCFGLLTPVGDYRLALVYASFLFLPAAALAWMLPEPVED